MKRQITLACCGMLIVGSGVIAQRRVPGATTPRTVGVAIALKAGGDAYAFTGQASCTHAPVASIYGIVAEQWFVQQADGARSAQLTLWRPKNRSADMFSLSFGSGAASHRVNTIKAAGAPPPQGSGGLTLTPAGNGGTFTISANAADGTVITGTIKCDAFLPAIAEGG